jgi:hypothetical protein
MFYHETLSLLQFLLTSAINQAISQQNHIKLAQSMQVRETKISPESTTANRSRLMRNR